MSKKKCDLRINGGTAVRSSKNRLLSALQFGLILAVVLGASTSAMAQGLIFGTVSNSDLSSPANGQIQFIGFVGDADEEIRLESSVGAGYDAGNWFDDFRNYLTSNPGNPYDYRFYNTSNGEGLHLEGAIPSTDANVNAVLGTISWPAAPLGVTAVTVASSSVVVSWNQVAGMTYHVYRRAGTSQGSLFRMDDPTGSLANPGVATRYFIDNTVDGVSSYTYVVIAEDASGNLSPHSTLITANSAAVDSPVLVSIDPDSGAAGGGTILDVVGSGFDVSGTSVVFDVTPIAATVNSPFSLTVVAPPGTVNDSVDVLISNNASGFISNIFVNGFRYISNVAPAFAAVGPQSGPEQTLLEFTVTATDPDGDTPVLTALNLPGTAIFADSGNGTGLFSWTPGFADQGSYDVSFIATDALDPILTDSIVVTVTVLDAGNQPPLLAALADTTIAEGDSLSLAVSASDPDAEIPTLSATGLPTNANFTDNLDGTGLLVFNPDFTQEGAYPIVIKALDASLEVDSAIVTVTVTNVNQIPALAAIGAQATTEGIALSFPVTATDADGTVPVLSTSTLPGTAVFTDSLNGSGSFEWTPTFADSGTHFVSFFATDADFPSDSDSEVVTITVGDAGNQAPVLDTIADQLIAEGTTLNLTISASDPDGVIPALRAEGLPANAIFADSGDGTGLFSFSPDFQQSGAYPITFIADDGLLADTQIVTMTVTEAGNVPPVFDSAGNFTVNEGDSTVIVVTATDPDGGGVSPALSVNTIIAASKYTFVDSGNGTGVFTYKPDFFDAGIYTVNFFATDFGTPQRTGSAVSLVTVSDFNQPPIVDSVGPFAVLVNNLLAFNLVATDPTDPDTTNQLLWSTLGLPTGATFLDNGNNTGTFSWIPDASQLGPNTVTFIVIDQGLPQQSATLVVDISVVAGNVAPIIDTIGPRIITEGVPLTIDMTATDPDGTIPALSISGEPEGSSFVDNGDGTGVFTYTPGFLGTTRLTSVVFRATDFIDLTTELVIIQIDDAGDQIPVFDSIPAPSVVEGAQLVQIITASDPDGSPVLMDVDSTTLPVNASFADSGNGLASFSFDPDFTQAGLYDVSLIAYDGLIGDSTTLADTVVMTVTVTEAGNQFPVLAAVSDQTVEEGVNLSFGVSASDPDGTLPALSIAPLPTGATFTDNSDGTGTFNWTPGTFQQGSYPLDVVASDGALADSGQLTITVSDVNQLPFIFTSGGRDIFEFDTLVYVVQAFDADSTFPFVTAFLSGTDSLATNMTFVDARAGSDTLFFIPDFTQGGPAASPTNYNIVFQVEDETFAGVVQTSPTVTISVTDRNKLPEITLLSGPGPFTLDEGAPFNFFLQVSDDDGTSPPTLTANNLPDSNTSFSFDPLTLIGRFDFFPDFTQAGTYLVQFIANDDRNGADTAEIQVDVLDAGNQAPLFGGSSTPDTVLVPVDRNYEIVIAPYDPDLDSVTLEAFPVLDGATWTDHGDGTGVYSFFAAPALLDSILTITFVATDHPANTTDTLVTHSRVVSFLRGDVDNNKRYSTNDVASLISYLFRDGIEPPIAESADVDADGKISIGDISYLVYFLYRGGSAPSQ